VTQDENKAIEYYQRASDMSNAMAAYNLGVCYMNGAGVTQDKNKAIEYFQLLHIWVMQVRYSTLECVTIMLKN